MYMQALLGPATVGRQIPLVQVTLDSMSERKQLFYLIHNTKTSSYVKLFLVRHWQKHTIPSENVAASQTGVRLGNIALLLRWDWLGWWSDWRIRKSSSWLNTLSSIAVASNATFASSTPDLDLASIAPVWTPRVLDQPIINSIFSSIANNQYSMVDFRLCASSKNSIGIISKSFVTSVDVRYSSSISRYLITYLK